ncbi:MAG: hypothetical protein IH857_05590 [Deltaproteobacteria bacterium]|nr:hypothetical protein [Deltaproteobacteria bacterium]
MRQESLIIDEAGLSNDNPFRAIVEWDPALPGNFMVFPLGGTAERDDQIRATLEAAFSKTPKR